VTLYTRQRNSLLVRWEPDDENAGQKAVEAVVGAVESFPAEVTNDQAEQIREQYEELTGKP